MPRARRKVTFKQRDRYRHREWGLALDFRGKRGLHHPQPREQKIMVVGGVTLGITHPGIARNPSCISRRRVGRSRSFGGIAEAAHQNGACPWNSCAGRLPQEVTGLVPPLQVLHFTGAPPVNPVGETRRGKLAVRIG